MLRFIRHTRACALFALLVMVGSVPVAIAATLHDDDHDAAGQPWLVLHDESAHRIGASRAPAPEGQHCVVCHWFHSLHRTTVGQGRAIPTSSGVHRLLVTTIPSAAAAALATLAARAPPASL